MVSKTFPNINLFHIIPAHIKIMISSVRSTNSCRCDEVPPRLLYSYTGYIFLPLCYLCNHCPWELYQNYVQIWKRNHRIKRGEKSCLSTYIQVSLLTAFSIIFEKVMCYRVSYFWNSHTVFVDKQFHVKNKFQQNKTLFSFTDKA